VQDWRSPAPSTAVSGWVRLSSAIRPAVHDAALANGHQTAAKERAPTRSFTTSCWFSRFEAVGARFGIDHDAEHPGVGRNAGLERSDEVRRVDGRETTPGHDL